MAYDWTKNPIVPRGDLYAWHHYDPATSLDGFASDASGNGRHLSTASNKSILTGNVLNGQPGWYFNGARHPMIYDNDVTFKHVFIVASADEALFSGLRGLLSDSSAASLLTGNNGTDKFVDVSGSIMHEFRSADIGYPNNGEVAPVSGFPAVIELQIPAGLTMDAIQIGQQTTFTGRLWKGYFFEDLFFSEIQNECARKRIYEYFAMRYQLWQRSVLGVDVYPFAANRTRAAELDREEFVSSPYSGALKILERGSFSRAYDLPFFLREQHEFEAAEAFWQQHTRAIPFVFRDYRFQPYREDVVRFTTSVREQGSDVTFRFNYTFGVTSIDASEIPDVIPPTSLSEGPDYIVEG